MTLLVKEDRKSRTVLHTPVAEGIPLASDGMEAPLRLNECATTNLVQASGPSS